MHGENVGGMVVLKRSDTHGGMKDGYEEIGKWVQWDGMMAIMDDNGYEDLEGEMDR